MRKTAIISGYATVDYPVRLAAPLRGAQTASVEPLAGREWPRAGGAALYASSRIAAAGHIATAFVTAGQDANGAIYRDACRAASVCIEPFANGTPSRTPWCMLMYHDDGSHSCLIDRGAERSQAIAPAQFRLLARADFVCIAAGPAALGAALLDRLPSQVPLAWIVKRDAESFPRWLACRLARRADLIFCNAAERSMVDMASRGAARPGQTIIETRGAKGALIQHDGQTTVLACGEVVARDATGAGDTLAGEVIAALLSGETRIAAAVEQGMAAARELLRQRAS